MLPSPGDSGSGPRVANRSVASLAFVGHDGGIGPYRSTVRVATDRPLSVAVLLVHDEAGSGSATSVAEALVAAL